MPGRTLTHHATGRSQGPPGSWLLRIRWILIVGYLAGGFALAASDAQAHEGSEFGIETPLERIAPGDDLPIIGAEWAPNVVLEIRIQLPGAELAKIAEIRTDQQGHFAGSVRVPETAQAGTAVIQAVSTYGVLDNATVTIDAAAAPPPGAGAAAVPVDDGLDPLPVVALAAAVAAVGLLALRTGGRAGAR